MVGINAIHKERWNLTCSVYLYHMELASSVQTVTAVWHIIIPLCARASSLHMEAIEERRRVNGERHHYGSFPTARSTDDLQRLSI
jgi:hypothetical protein